MPASMQRLRSRASTLAVSATIGVAREPRSASMRRIAAVAA